jgi:hypothetical protein
VNAAEPAPEAAVPAETAAKKGSFDELPPEYSAAVTLTPEQQLSKAL